MAKDESKPSDILCVRLIDLGEAKDEFRTVFQLGPYPGWTLALAELALHLTQAAAQVIYNNPDKRQWQALARFPDGKEMWLNWEFKHVAQLARVQNETIQKDMEAADAIDKDKTKT